MAQLVPVRTEAEEALLGEFDRIFDRLPGNETVMSARKKAIDRFGGAGFPHRRIEEWKYSDLKAQLKTFPKTAERVDIAALKEAIGKISILDGVSRSRIVIANGRFVAELSDIDELGEDIQISSMSDALDSGQTNFEAPVRSLSDIAIVMNTALCVGGVVIRIADNCTLTKPLELLNYTHGKVSCISHNLVLIGHGVDIKLFETFVGNSEGAHINALCDFHIGDNAIVNILQIQDLPSESSFIATSRARIGSNVKFEHLSIAAGSKFARAQQYLSLDGENTNVELSGITIARNGQHSDQTIVLDHVVPDCTSTENFRSVIGDRSSGVFQGRINVHQIAQKTDGKMMSQALLLSDNARFCYKPELEIFADDVQCGHGATCGQLDENQLFYLLSRGISREDAEQLLTMAFLAELVDEFDDETLVASLRKSIDAWLTN